MTGPVQRVRQFVQDLSVGFKKAKIMMSKSKLGGAHRVLSPTGKKSTPSATKSNNFVTPELLNEARARLGKVFDKPTTAKTFEESPPKVKNPAMKAASNLKSYFQMKIAEFKQNRAMSAKAKEFNRSFESNTETTKFSVAVHKYQNKDQEFEPKDTEAFESYFSQENIDLGVDSLAALKDINPSAFNAIIQNLSGSSFQKVAEKLAAKAENPEEFKASLEKAYSDNLNQRVQDFEHSVTYDDEKLRGKENNLFGKSKPLMQMGTNEFKNNSSRIHTVNEVKINGEEICKKNEKRNQDAVTTRTYEALSKMMGLKRTQEEIKERVDFSLNGVYDKEKFSSEEKALQGLSGPDVTALKIMSKQSASYATVPLYNGMKHACEKLGIDPYEFTCIVLGKQDRGESLEVSKIGEDQYQCKMGLDIPLKAHGEEVGKISAHIEINFSSQGEPQISVKYDSLTLNDDVDLQTKQQLLSIVQSAMSFATQESARSLV